MVQELAEMPWVDTKKWVDDRTGPNAFQSRRLFNQALWVTNPDRADAEICEVMATGGFEEDCIARQVGNYEGQIMAIRRGLVDEVDGGWRINNAGREFLRSKGWPAPVFLKALDGYHGSEFTYCIYETVLRSGSPALKLAEQLIPSIGVGMKPLHRRKDAESLRNYLSDWLARTP